MNFRVRSKTGVYNLRNVDLNLSFADFKCTLQRETGIPIAHQKILGGFPPKEIIQADAEKIGKFLANGDVLTVEAIENNSVEQPKTQPQQQPQPQPQPHLQPQPQQPQQPQPQPQPQPQTQAPPPQSQLQSQPQPQPQPQSHQPAHQLNIAPGLMTDGGPIKRPIPDDNSCLFHAIGYVLENKQNKVTELRKLVAEKIKSDFITFNEGILGKSPSEYQKWIQLPNSWGGAIELTIFADHYQTEIVAYDVVTKRANCFAEDKGYQQRVYLIYDGIHYDVLAWNLIPSEPLPDFDVTVFSPFDENVHKAFKQLVEQEHSKGRFVDVNAYVVVCNDCGKKLVGDKEVTAHAMQTRHSNFGQVK